MATTIDMETVMQPAEAALTNMEQALDRTADSVGQAVYLPAGMRDGMMAMVAAGKAHVAGARQIKQGLADYAKASLDASISAAKASMAATSLDDAMAVQRGHLVALMNDGLAQGSKLAELALAASEKAAAPLRQQMGRPMEGPWTTWFNAAA
ncbi:MAG: phasin family protein [Alphaproteobacteria bacterium]